MQLIILANFRTMLDILLSTNVQTECQLRIIQFYNNVELGKIKENLILHIEINKISISFYIKIYKFSFYIKY